MSKLNQGFSLLELVLAVGLSVVLLVLIGFAIDQHYFRLEAGRTTIEESSLARAVMNRIATDLRSVTSAPTQDVSEQMSLAEQAALFNVDQVDQDQSDAGQDELINTGLPTDSLPGVYGTLNELQLDLRMVRQAIVESALGPDEPPVAMTEAGWAHVRYHMVVSGEYPGLYRSESAREAVLWAQEQAAPLSLGSRMSDQVAALRFRYFDGQQFYESWDQTEMEELPRAIEIEVDFFVSSNASKAKQSEGSPSPMRTYRQVVFLNAAYEEAQSGSGGNTAELESALGGGI